MDTSLTDTRRSVERKSDTAYSQQDRAFAAFRRRLHAGDFNALLGRGLQRTLSAAAADQALDLEMGAIRLALLRLIRDEPDLPRLAAGVARLSNVAVQIARERSTSNDPSNEMRQILERELELLDQEDQYSPSPPSSHCSRWSQETRVDDASSTPVRGPLTSLHSQAPLFCAPSRPPVILPKEGSRPTNLPRAPVRTRTRGGHLPPDLISPPATASHKPLSH